MTRRKQTDWLAHYRAWQKSNAAPWTAYADFPRIAARAADFMKAGGAPDADIFLVYGHLIAKGVMGPIEYENSILAAQRRPSADAFKRIHDSPQKRTYRSGKVVTAKPLSDADRARIRKLDAELAAHFPKKYARAAEIERRTGIRQRTIEDVLELRKKKK